MEMFTASSSICAAAGIFRSAGTVSRYRTADDASANIASGAFLGSVTRIDPEILPRSHSAVGLRTELRADPAIRLGVGLGIGQQPVSPPLGYVRGSQGRKNAATAVTAVHLAVGSDSRFPKTIIQRRKSYQVHLPRSSNFHRQAPQSLLVVTDTRLGQGTIRQRRQLRKAQSARSTRGAQAFANGSRCRLNFRIRNCYSY